jgi:type II secretory pathway component GspD/PulD (secretin)
MTRIYMNRFWLTVCLLFLIFIPKVCGQSSQIALSFKNADIKDVLRALADQAGVNLIVDDRINGAVSIHLAKLTFIEALNTICKTNFLSYTNDNRVYHIFKPDNAKLTVNFKDGLLSVEAKNVSLPKLMEEISRQTGFSIIPDQNVTQTISIYFQDMPVLDGITTLCEANNLKLITENKAWRISNRNGNFRVRAANDLVTIDATDTNASLLFNEIARQSGTAITVGKDVRGNVTIQLNNVSVAQALAAIVESQGWVLEKHSNYYLVNAKMGSNQNIHIVYDPDTQKFDLDVQTSPLAALLYEMARKADLNLVILAQVNWTVNTVRLQGQTFEQALQYLFKGTNYTYIKTDDTYLIGDGMVSRPENSDFAVVKIYPIKYIKAEQLLNTLPSIFSKQNFTQLQEKNALIVSAPQSIHDMFVKYLEQVDVPMIEDQTEVIKVNYMKAEDLLKNLPKSISKSDIIVIKEQNALAVTGPQNLINQVRQYVAKIDQVNPMIVFDILVVQISGDNNLYWNTSSSYTVNGNNHQLAVSPTDGTLTLNKLIKATTTSGSKTDTLTSLATLSALIGEGKAKVLANPTISTLNGYQTSFSVSTKRNYTVATQTVVDSSSSTTVTESVKTYESGLYFSILPWVSANNQITMEIKPKYSEFGAAPAGSDLPSTFERNSETTIRAQNKQTVIISGLKRTSLSDSMTKIPILGDLPLIGWLFRSRSKEKNQDEFVIVITPYLVYDQTSQNEANQKITGHFEDQDIKKIATPVPDPAKEQPARNGSVENEPSQEPAAAAAPRE